MQSPPGVLYLLKRIKLMNNKMFNNETPIIFLAMFWGGGGPYTIAQIIHVYDWINRDIPSRSDLEIAINTLLSLNLIKRQDDKFIIPKNIGNDFDGYRKKKRKRKFATARMYFEQFNPPPEMPPIFELSEELYKSALNNYLESF